MRDETIAIHGGYVPDGTRASAVPIYQTVANDFDSAEHAAAVFDMETPGFHYNRVNNPTNDVLEKRLAALEGGIGALTVASGAAAVTSALRTVTRVGATLVAAPQLYSATYTFLAHLLANEGVQTRFGTDATVASLEHLIDDSTVAVFCESIGNPAGNIADLLALSEMAHRCGVPLIVDNTVATPLLLKPFEHGADIVVHSLTKFIGGHGTTLGGAIIDSGRFPWHENPGRFPCFNEPEPACHGWVYTERFGSSAFIARCRTVIQRNVGAALSPFNAFLLLQGLETLPLRLERHQSNARAVAEYLRAHPQVAWVRYAGFPDHPDHELAARYLKDRYPSVFTFGVHGGYEAAMRFFDAVKLFKRLVNLGDAKSLIAHPASTTHRQLSAEAQAIVGVTPEMLRLSVGLEHIDDLIEDIDQGLAAASPVS